MIYADPPWSYRDKANAGNRGASHKYSTMSLDSIKNLPVKDLADDNCALFLWVTMPLLPDCLSVIEAWGFKYKTVAFTWVKTHSPSGKFCVGMGNYTRANAEICILATKGKMPVKSHSVRSLIVSPRREHSQKPDEARDGIVELFGDVPRIELFARQRIEGWHAWGDQVPGGNDVELDGEHFK